MTFETEKKKNKNVTTFLIVSIFHICTKQFLRAQLLSYTQQLDNLRKKKPGIKQGLFSELLE